MGEEIRVGRRCFVSNLAWRTSWQDLKDKFRECGNVVYANVMRDGDRYWFSCHYYDRTERGRSRLAIMPLTWAPDGWPHVRRH